MIETSQYQNEILMTLIKRICIMRIGRLKSGDKNSVEYEGFKLTFERIGGEEDERMYNM